MLKDLKKSEKSEERKRKKRKKKAWRDARAGAATLGLMGLKLTLPATLTSDSGLLLPRRRAAYVLERNSGLRTACISWSRRDCGLGPDPRTGLQTTRGPYMLGWNVIIAYVRPI